MKRWQWYLQRMAALFGPAGLAGIVMIAAAVLLQFGMIRQAQDALADMQAQLAELRRQPPPVPQAGPEQKLAQFYGFFPQHAALSQQLRMLHEMTDQHQLYMGRVDYKLSRVNGTPLMRYAVSYALVADYPSLRIYLADVLRALPNAALEDIELQRYSDNAQMLEASIDLALYYRDGL